MIATFSFVPEEESAMVKQALKIFENASGQMINYQKSSILFSANASASCRQSICNSLGVPKTMNQGKYLGLPSLIGKNKTQIFSFVKDKAWSRMQG